MIYALGPRAQRVYHTLHARLGELRSGVQLPTIPKLVAEFGVAPLTIRHVLATLEEEGFISREQGRGTFVRERMTPTVLVVDDEPSERILLATLVQQLGYKTVEAADSEAGLAALERNPSIVQILSDVRIPLHEQGLAFIRAVRQRWPQIPLAAVTGFPEDLLPLHGTADCPVLIVPKPVYPQYIEAVMRLTMRHHSFGHDPLWRRWTEEASPSASARGPKLMDPALSPRAGGFHASLPVSAEAVQHTDATATAIRA